jgi:hypothetical protein
MSDRLRELNELLQRAEQQEAEIKEGADDAAALVRELRAKIAEEKRRRRHLRGLSLIPPVGAGVAWLVQRIREHVIIVSNAALSAATLALGISIGSHETPHHTPRPRHIQRPGTQPSPSEPTATPTTPMTHRPSATPHTSPPIRLPSIPTRAVPPLVPSPGSGVAGLTPTAVLSPQPTTSTTRPRCLMRYNVGRIRVDVDCRYRSPVKLRPLLDAKQDVS